MCFAPFTKVLKFRNQILNFYLEARIRLGGQTRQGARLGESSQVSASALWHDFNDILSSTVHTVFGTLTEHKPDTQRLRTDGFTAGA